MTSRTDEPYIWRDTRRNHGYILCCPSFLYGTVQTQRRRASQQWATTPSDASTNGSLGNRWCFKCRRGSPRKGVTDNFFSLERGLAFLPLAVRIQYFLFLLFYFFILYFILFWYTVSESCWIFKILQLANRETSVVIRTGRTPVHSYKSLATVLSVWLSRYLHRNKRGTREPSSKIVIADWRQTKRELNERLKINQLIISWNW